jgi:hypothetical protein
LTIPDTGQTEEGENTRQDVVCFSHRNCTPGFINGCRDASTQSSFPRPNKSDFGISSMYFITRSNDYKNDWSNYQN